MRSLLRGITAVCGMGRPSGRRKRAVTANQSAQAPTVPASANARTQASHGARAGHRAAATLAATNTTAISASSPVASARMRASAVTRGSAVVWDRAGRAVVKRQDIRPHAGRGEPYGLRRLIRRSPRFRTAA